MGSPTHLRRGYGVTQPWPGLGHPTGVRGVGEPISAVAYPMARLSNPTGGVVHPVSTLIILQHVFMWWLAEP